LEHCLCRSRFLGFQGYGSRKAERSSKLRGERDELHLRHHKDVVRSLDRHFGFTLRKKFSVWTAAISLQLRFELLGDAKALQHLPPLRKG
jgi:hypothetical protein